METSIASHYTPKLLRKPYIADEKIPEKSETAKETHLSAVVEDGDTKDVANLK